MSEQLLRAINKVQSAISDHPGEFQQEQQTIHFLIHPVLNALGWHTNDLKRVRYEFPVGRGRVDMALLREDKPIVFVEAKALGTELGEKESEQLGGYCYHKGVPTALLTNGVEWRVYRPLLTSLPFEQRLLFSVHLGEPKAVTAAVKELSRLSYDMTDRLEDDDWRVLLDRYWSEHANEVLLKPFAVTLRESFAISVGKKTTEIPNRAVTAFLKGKLGLQRRPVSPRPRPRPSPQPATGYAVVLAGEHIPIKYAKDVLIQTAEWLVGNGKIQPAICPIQLGKGGRYLVHTRDQHSNGSLFAGPKSLSNGLFLETNFSARDSHRQAFNLLKGFGYTPPEDTLQIIGFDN